ncbi:MAG: hypothetical protein Q4F29_13495, partial [Lachnospiraceae bacterium]|nr:hypothetical protein [Lachnospiraceae bacterium]
MNAFLIFRTSRFHYFLNFQGLPDFRCVPVLPVFPALYWGRLDARHFCSAPRHSPVLLVLLAFQVLHSGRLGGRRFPALHCGCLDERRFPAFHHFFPIFRHFCPVLHHSFPASRRFGPVLRHFCSALR